MQLLGINKSLAKSYDTGLYCKFFRIRLDILAKTSDDDPRDHMGLIQRYFFQSKFSSCYFCETILGETLDRSLKHGFACMLMKCAKKNLKLERNSEDKGSNTISKINKTTLKNQKMF